MDARSRMELTPNDLELWTSDDAESWKEADTFAASQAWADDDDLLLDNDLWMEGDDGCMLTVRGHGHLSLRGCG